MRRFAPGLAAVWLSFATVAQVYADTQGSPPASSPDKNLWLGAVVLVLLIGSLLVIRPRTRR